jgi:U3 small nucleolar RNA-associated protein 14
MVETKRKARDETKDKKMKKQKSLDSKAPAKNKKRTGKKSEERKRTGPRLPNSLRKELERLNPSTKLNSDDEEIDSDEGEFNTNDFYEYQEEIPQEESRKNRRFDPIDNFEYELPEDFKVISLTISVLCFAL